MSKRGKGITVNISETTHRKLKVVCAARGLTIGDGIARAVSGWVGNGEQLARQIDRHLSPEPVGK